MRRILAMLTVVATMAACDGDPISTPTAIAGDYTATTFLLTPAGGEQTDVLEAGGVLSIMVAGDRAIEGVLAIPGSITGSEPLVVDMVGTADVEGSTVEFDQNADTFVRDLTWSVVGKTLTATDVTVGGVTYTIVLTRDVVVPDAMSGRARSR